MRRVPFPSPNFSARPQGIRPTGIILHADAGASEAGTLAWLANPKSGVSYHFLVGRGGAIYDVVDSMQRAWHAGVSEAGGRGRCNDWTVGVSFANRQDGQEPFSAEQLAAGVELVRELRRRYGIPLDCIWTHEQVARPEGRKSDPGPLFPLAAFLRAVRGPL